MYDARLVTAAQEGDEAAFAAIFDRYVDGLYDLCWSITGDGAEAGRLVTDTFVLAARYLTELTDPSQVRPWLLAIARDRALVEDDAGTLQYGWGQAATGVGSDVEGPLGQAALRRWTAEAASVLALTDQIALELQVRHGLDGDQLAAAIGCPLHQLPRVMGQVLDEAEHVLGALVLARQGRGDCPELASILVGWDGSPSPDVADTVDAHAVGCERCAQRRGLASAVDLMAAAPVVAAPGDLRPHVLDEVAVELAALGAAAPPSSPAAVVPQVPPAAAAEVVTTVRSRPDPPTLARLAPILGIAAAVALLLGALFLVFHTPGHQKVASSTRTATTLSAGGAIDPGAGTAPPTLVPVDSTTTSTTPMSGRLELTASRVDLGANATSAGVVLSNSGQGAAQWAAASGAPWLRVSPASGRLQPGASQSVTMVVSRSAAPAGPFDVKVTFSSADGGVPASLDVVGTNGSTTTTSPSTSTTVGAGPAISGLSASPSVIKAAPCNPDTATVTVTVSDANVVTGVVLKDSLPDGRTSTTPMAQSGNQWSATVGPSGNQGTITYSVTATDSTGATRTGGPQSITVQPCV